MFLQEEPHGRNKVFRLKVTTQAVDTVWAKSGGLRGLRCEDRGAEPSKWEAPALMPENSELPT